MIRAELSGFLSRDFPAGMAPPMDLGLAPAAAYYSREVDIEDARPLQERAKTEAQLFADHGFTLLAHQTRVRDWDREVASIYAPEVVEIIRNCLFPERRIEILQRANLIRRGPDQRYYAARIHADGPLTVDGYALNLATFGGPPAVRRWREAYSRDAVAGFVSIGLWRTTNMKEPLRHMPLALCDPVSVDRADIAPTTSGTIAPMGGTTHHLVLRHNPRQAWYYYPEMTGEEVLAMTVCRFMKDDPDAQQRNVFHTAFEDPTTPVGAEVRQSCEHRVGVMILRD
jgi:hypothetical protein